MDAIQEKVGRRIKSLRKQKGLSQEAVAEKAEVSAKYLGSIERGEANLTLDILERIGRTLEIAPQTLLEAEHEATREELLAAIQKELGELSDRQLQLAYRHLAIIKES